MDLESALNLFWQFFLFDTLESSALERFTECVEALGGTLICVDPLKKIWIGNHRQIILYRAKASLHTPHHDLKTSPKIKIKINSYL